jgi:hypothetical protein
MICLHCNDIVLDLCEHLYNTHGYVWADAVNEANYQYESAREEHPSKWVKGDL